MTTTTPKLTARQQGALDHPCASAEAEDRDRYRWEAITGTGLYRVSLTVRIDASSPYWHVKIWHLSPRREKVLMARDWSKAARNAAQALAPNVLPPAHGGVREQWEPDCYRLEADL